MLKQKILFPAFIVLVILQLFVPARMIYEQERVLKTGKAFKFKTAPVDPTDIFRGKYVQLSFADNQVRIGEEEEWKRGESVYVRVSVNQEGFAILSEVSKTAPEDTEDYFKATISNTGLIKNVIVDPAFRKLTLNFPFDRFYMEESKALEAENRYREALRAGNGNVAYALVHVKNGSAVLQDVLLNDVPLRELVTFDQ